MPTTTPERAPPGVGPLLDIQGLHTHFETARGTLKAVNGVDLQLAAGDTLGIVGESGSGKTVLALSIIRLVPSPPGRIVSGRILFDGRDLLALPEGEMRRIRGRDISMVFQEPMTSLNPVFRVGEQVAEVIRLHQGLSKGEALARTADMFHLVGLPSPEQRLRDYPHQMSGGMRQRVMIAMALACHPRLMLADEPTTALDVTIQAQILDLMNRLKSELGISVILITHDLGVMAEAAQFVAVMYAGLVVEYAPVSILFATPLHPYTIGLMASVPRITGGGGRASLQVIPGSVPALYDLPPGCPFQDRCDRAEAICREKEPVLREVSPGHRVRCWMVP